MMILGFPDSAVQARKLAEHCGDDYAEVQLHRFPDGESKVTLPQLLVDKPSPEIILFRSLHQPNNKLIELLLACQGARDLGVNKITLVCPYLCYMRQDIAFHPGEVVSQQVIGRWLGQMVDRLITVDPHLHRIHKISEAVSPCKAISLSAMAPMAQFLRARGGDPILLGPDEESRQWVKELAEEAALNWSIALKERRGDYNVVVTPPELNIKGRELIIVDDIISTGRTVSRAATLFKEQGAKSINCLVTHALFSSDAEELLRQSDVDEVWSTDSVCHGSNAIELAELLTGSLNR